MKIYEGSNKAEILKEHGFKRFDADSVTLYEEYRKKMKGPTGVYTRTSVLLCWEFYTIPYYTVRDGFFIIVNDDGFYGKFTAYAPAGDYEDTEGLYKAVSFLADIFAELDEQFSIMQVKEWMKPYLDRMPNIEFEYSYDESESEYLYNLEELRGSIERRSVHYNHRVGEFIERYDPEVQNYKDEDYEELMEMVEEKYCSRGNCDDCVFGCMKMFYECLIKYTDIIRGRILTIRSHGKMIAFHAFVDDEDLLYIAAQTLSGLFGHTEYLNKYMVDEFSEKYETVNFEEDMGIESIRLHKRVVGPYTLSHNYHASLTVTSKALKDNEKK